MSKEYQNDAARASGLAVSGRVSVAVDEVAADVWEGLLAMAVGAGLQVLAAMMEADVTAACGPRGAHDPDRAAVRHGRERGSVTLGGRRVPVSRPRVRRADGSGELPVPSYELFTATEVMGRMAMQRMLAGLSSRHYPVGLEPVGEPVERVATATSKSADLSTLDLVAFMVDGVHFGEHTCVVALGVDSDGVKQPLALGEGSTENATLVRDLIVGLGERGLDVTGPSWPSSTARRRCAGRSSTYSIIRSSPAASCKRSVMLRTGCRRSCARWWPKGCAAPTTPSPQWPPRPSSRPSPGNWTAATPARPRACGKDSRRP